MRKEAASGDSGNNSNNGGTDSGNSGGDSGTDNGNSGGDSEKGGYSTDFLLENGKISRVGVGSAAQDVLNHISFTGGAYGKVTHSDGSANDGIVGTGDVLTIYDKNGGEMARYTFVIYGDVNGDGAGDEHGFTVCEAPHFRNKAAGRTVSDGGRCKPWK